MSTAYRIDICVHLKEQFHYNAVMNAILTEWPVDKDDVLDDDAGYVLTASGEHYVSDGILEVVNNIAKAIQTVVGDVPIDITLHHIEQTPREFFHYGPGEPEEEVEGCSHFC